MTMTIGRRMTLLGTVLGAMLAALGGGRGVAATLDSTMIRGGAEVGQEQADYRDDGSVVLDVKTGTSALHVDARFDALGLPLAMTRDDSAQASKESFARDGAGAVWRNRLEQGSVAEAGGRYYVPLGLGDSAASAPSELALLARALLQSPARKLLLLPQGEASAEIVDETTLTRDGVTQMVRLIAIRGLLFAPQFVWLDDQNRFFAAFGDSIVMRSDWRMAADMLAERQRAAAARLFELRVAAARLPAAGPVVIRHVSVFDSTRGTLVPEQTVILQNGRIRAVAPTRTGDSAGAGRVIDGLGKTLLPGFWSMGGHPGRNDGLMDLAAGVTSLGLAAPASGGDLPPGLHVVTIAPDRAVLPLLQVVADDATLTDAVVQTLKTLDPRGDAIGQRMTQIRDRKAAVDVSLTPWRERLSDRPGALPSTVAPMADRLPLQVMRLMRDSGGRTTEVATPADAEVAFAKLAQIIKRLDDAGVPLVLGTDGHGLPGLAYLRALELLRDAGLPPARILQIATIDRARLMGMDQDYGAIAPGKVADVVLIDGDPLVDFGAVRRISHVFTAGVGYKPQTLWAAAGFAPRR